MRKFARVAGLAVAFCLVATCGFAKMPVATKSHQATIVIIFKDGHRQSFNLSEIARVEFPGNADAVSETGSGNSLSPSRGRFLGKWEVGDGAGNNFFITLDEDGNAERSLHDIHGKWVYIDGEARVTWDDGAQDAIRKVGSRFQKFAYMSGKSFTDAADNVTNARNTTPHPI